MERHRAGRLVGRDLELGTVDRLLANLADGHGGQLVLVTGEPGIGKSSLLDEVGRRADHAGCGVLRAGCWEGEAPSYWLWQQLLRDLRDLGGLPESGPSVGLLEDAGGSQHGGHREFEIFDSVARAIVEQSRRRPLVVLLDDLQWADEGSVRLLAFLRTSAAAHPVLVVGAFRDDEAGPSLEALATGAVSLALPGLDRDSVVTVMTDVAGPRPPDRLATQVMERCRGNPFFVRETARLAFTSSGGWDDLTAGGAVPAGVRAVVRRRLEQLSAETRGLLALIAVAGDEVETRVVSAATEGSSTTSLLAEAEQARVLVRYGGRVAFAHDLFRDVVLADLSPTSATEIHGRLATALASVVEAELEAGRSASAETRGRLAVHFAAAGDGFAPEAVRRSVEAGRAALGHDEACRHYERALALLGRLGDEEHDDLPDRLDLELGVATARAHSGRHHEARGDLAVVAAAARTAGRPDVLAEAALATHALGARTSTQVLTTLALLEDALSAATANDLARLSQLRAARSRMLSRIPGRRPEALASAREAIELARAAGDPAVEFYALLAQHDLSWSADGQVTADELGQRLALCDELVRVAEVEPGRERLTLAHQLRAAALIEHGDPEGLTELLRHCELADAGGTARGRWWSTSRRAVLAVMDGRVDEALALTTEASRLGTMMGEPDAIGCDQSLRCSLAVLGVDGWDAVVGPPADDPLWKIRHVLSAAHALVAGDTATARVEVRRGLPADDAFYSVDLLAIAAWVWAACGPDPERERLFGLLAPWAGRHLLVGGCASYYGPADRLRGDLADALGRHGEAAELYDAARDAARRLGVLAWSPPDTTSGPKRLMLSRDGATWKLSFEGRIVHLPDAKGLHDLATLVANPGRDLHVLTLLGRPGPAFGADAVLDDEARAAYRARVGAIDRALDDADRAGDSQEGERLAAERVALVSELATATGLGGRPRRLADESERARKTVGARLRDSLRRIEDVDPALGRYLRSSVRIGTECRYTPD
jgi:tetratricopeptide (TPR) repeat protein